MSVKIRVEVEDTHRILGGKAQKLIVLGCVHTGADGYLGTDVTLVFDDKEIKVDRKELIAALRATETR